MHETVNAANSAFHPNCRGPVHVRGLLFAVGLFMALWLSSHHAAADARTPHRPPLSASKPRTPCSPRPTLTRGSSPAGAATLLFLPLAHVFARIIEVGMLEAGAVLGHWPDPNTLADGLAEFRPTFVLAVPRVFENIYYSAQRPGFGEQGWYADLRRGGTRGRRVERGAGRRARGRARAHCPAPVFEMPLTVVRDLRPVVSQRMTLPLSFLDRRH